MEKQNLKQQAELLKGHNARLYRTVKAIAKANGREHLIRVKLAGIRTELYKN